MVTVIDVPVEFQTYFIRIGVLFRSTQCSGVVDTLFGSNLLYIIEKVLCEIPVNLCLRALGTVGIVVFLIGALIVSKEEQLVLNDGTTQSNTPGVIGHSAIVLRVVTIMHNIAVANQVAILEISVDASVEVVGTRLGDSVDRTTSEARLTDIERSNTHLQLVDGLHGEGLCTSLSTVCTITCQTEHIVGHGTVNLDRVITVVGSGNGDGTTF